MEQVSDESSQDSMNSNQSAVSSVKSDQSAEGSTKSSQASEGSVKSNQSENRRSSQVLKATTQNSDHDQEELSSNSGNQKFR